MATLSRLQAWEFRNLRHLDLPLGRGITLLLGPNGQGKSNVMEAICYLGLLRSFRTQGIGDLYRDLPAGERPRTDAEKRDQCLVRFSRTVGRDLGPFFEAWGVPTSPEARATVALARNEAPVPLGLGPIRVWAGIWCGAMLALHAPLVWVCVRVTVCASLRTSTHSLTGAWLLIAPFVSNPQLSVLPP